MTGGAGQQREGGSMLTDGDLTWGANTQDSTQAMNYRIVL